MIVIDSMLVSHKPNIIPGAKPMRQKVRRFHPDRHRIIQIGMGNLLRAGFIREVKYPEWLANVVVVIKNGGKWRVYVNYTDLNEACRKNSFPLPRIYHIVNASVGHGMLSSLDAFFGYHQIPMHLLDTEKMTFITLHEAILLQCNAFWLEECRSGLSEAGDQDISTTDGQDHGSLHRRYACQIQRTSRSHKTIARNL